MNIHNQINKEIDQSPPHDLGFNHSTPLISVPRYMRYQPTSTQIAAAKKETIARSNHAWLGGIAVLLLALPAPLSMLDLKTTPTAPIQEQREMFRAIEVVAPLERIIKEEKPVPVHNFRVQIQSVVTPDLKERLAAISKRADEINLTH